jgi:hypothetical protein
MQDRSLFISSCSRRELARRKPARTFPLGRLLVTLAIVLIAFAAVLAARGGL